MADEPQTLSDEELEEQEAEQLPDRETMMMIVEPGPGVEIEPVPWPESEAPDDRYEQ